MSDDVVQGYARGLLAILEAEGGADTAADELFAIGKEFEKHHELKQALSDAAIPMQQREKVLTDVLGKKISPHSLGVLEFILVQNRARLLPQIIERLVELAAEAREAVVAEVRSAIALDADEQKRLAEALSKATGKKVEVQVVVDPSVIGGIVTKVGDTVIDGSVRRRLEDLKGMVRA